MKNSIVPTPPKCCLRKPKMSIRYPWIMTGIHFIILGNLILLKFCLYDIELMKLNNKIDFVYFELKMHFIK